MSYPIPYKTKKEVDSSIRSTLASLEQERTAMADTPNGLFQRALTVYRGVRPLFTALAVLPLIPSNWRKTIAAIVAVLDPLVEIGADVVLQFKAGRDLVKDEEQAA